MSSLKHVLYDEDIFGGMGRLSLTVENSIIILYPSLRFNELIVKIFFFVVLY